MITNHREIRLVPKPVHDDIAREPASGYCSSVARARRYEIGAVMRYRIRGKKEWHEGIMKNMSISGVLLSTSYCLPLETVIEMRFSLPLPLIGGESAAEVLCRGSVVRISKGELDERSMVAARVTHSRFLRREK